MKLVIGLGNPGEEYVGTRHNVGYEVVRALADDWKMEKKLFSEIAKRNEVVYALPTTYMNESGKAAHALIWRFGIDQKNLILIHDDIDLPLGTIRITQKSGPAGHKGIVSIFDALGVREMIRVRIGVAGKGRARIDAATYVLKKFSKGERAQLLPALDRAREAITIILKDGVDRAMNIYNGSRDL